MTDPLSAANAIATSRLANAYPWRFDAAQNAEVCIYCGITGHEACAMKNATVVIHEIPLHRPGCPWERAFDEAFTY